MSEQISTFCDRCNREQERNDDGRGLRQAAEAIFDLTMRSAPIPLGAGQFASVLAPFFAAARKEAREGALEEAHNASCDQCRAGWIGVQLRALRSEKPKEPA